MYEPDRRGLVFGVANGAALGLCILYALAALLISTVFRGFLDPWCLHGRNLYEYTGPLIAPYIAFWFFMTRKGISERRQQFHIAVIALVGIGICIGHNAMPRSFIPCEPSVHDGQR
jgi:ABC-type Fe3+-siderophore transport system permease subunit